MSNSLIAITALIYLGVAISEYRDGHMGLCLMFASYAAANVGVILANHK